MSLEYVEWLFPDFAECFFPTKNNEETRRLQWPGLRIAVWCLVLEAMHFLLGLLMLVITTSVWGFYLVTGSLRDGVIPELPPATGPKRGERFPVTTLDASKGQVTSMLIQGFISRSEPVIIKNLPKEFFSTMAIGGKYADPVRKDMLESGKVVGTTYTPRGHLGGFEKWIRQHVQKRVEWMVRLSGSYAGSTAHIDGHTYDIYYVARGQKRVWICPRQYTHLLNLHSGIDHLYIPGSDPTSPDPHEWIQSVPGVWTFVVKEGDVLLFNNAGNVHKFENISERPEIYSVRVLNSDISPILAKLHVFNWGQARHIAKLAIRACSQDPMSVYLSCLGCKVGGKK